MKIFTARVIIYQMTLFLVSEEWGSLWVWWANGILAVSLKISGPILATIG